MMVLITASTLLLIDYAFYLYISDYSLMDFVQCDLSRKS